MSHNFLEQLVSEWYSYKGYLVKQNVLVGKRPQGGYECELDVVAFKPNPEAGESALVHVEPSMDCHSWTTREKRYHKKFEAGRKHIPSIFKGYVLPSEIEQIALFEYASGKNHSVIGGGKVKLVKELLRDIRIELLSKKVCNDAVSEHMPLLRMVQFMTNYHDFVFCNDNNLADE